MEGLGINLPTLIAQIVNFVILFGLLYLVAYKPIVGMLNSRSDKIKESMEQVEIIKQQAARSEEEIKAQIEAARGESQAIIAQASQIGERLKEEAKKEARQEAESLIARSRLEIQRERNDAIDELRREVVDVAIVAAEKVIKESLDKPAHHRLIQEVLEESSSLKKG